MPNAEHVRHFRTEHVSKAPRGARIRTVLAGRHRVIVAYPGAHLVEILHPIAEKNPCPCDRAQAAKIAAKYREPEIGKRKGANPAELVIFGNPRKKRGKRITPKAKAVGSTRRRQKKGGRRRNAGDGEEMMQAVELYEAFHGKDPRGVIEQQRSARMRTTYTAIGPLLAIGMYVPDAKIPEPDHWDEYPHLQFARSGPDVVRLASSPEGKQLYAIGGNQDCSGCLKDAGVDATKDLVDLGPVAYVVYEARKSMDNFELVEYMHTFDEPRPTLAYDQLKTEIAFIGGGYAVEAPGIVR